MPALCDKRHARDVGYGSHVQRNSIRDLIFANRFVLFANSESLVLSDRLISPSVLKSPWLIDGFLVRWRWDLEDKQH
jgi:hypothetical protein